MTPKQPCPQCGSALDIITDGQIGILWFNPETHCIEERLENRPFAACSGCEFCVDLTHAIHALKVGA